MNSIFFLLKSAYVIAQILGWSIYILVALILTYLRNDDLSNRFFLLLFSTFGIGLVLSHLYRNLIIRLRWLNLSISAIIPRFLLGSLAFGLLFQLLYLSISLTLFGTQHLSQIDRLAQEYTGWILVFLFWSVGYFFYHFFKNYKQEEINNLTLRAAQSEMELNRLKAQLNPHFIFNAMNSIKALVDEDAKKSKDAITQLSNILRKSMKTGGEKLIALEEEMKMVDDYLSLEAIRFEERLQVITEIPASLMSKKVPPMMVQTLVENAIKHGISHIPQGGTVRINAKTSEEFWVLRISNSGSLSEAYTEQRGIGLENSRKRLRLLFGEKADIRLTQSKGEVLTEIHIPNIV